jgi:hypothetical protein
MFVSDLVDELLFSEWCSTSSPHLEARLLGVSGTTLSQGSAGSGHGAELVLGEGSSSSSVVLLKVPSFGFGAFRGSAYCGPVKTLWDCKK